MNAAGTWPEPIMILRNDSELCLPNGLPLGTPYHLVEGHHRLGFLVAMNEDQPESVLAEHRARRTSGYHRGADEDE